MTFAIQGEADSAAGDAGPVHWDYVKERIMRRRMYAALAAPFLALALAACGSEEAPESPPDEPVQEETAEDGDPSDGAGEDTDQDSPAEDDGESDRTGGSGDDGEGSEEGSGSDRDGESTGGAATEIAHVWVEDDWKIEQIDEDLCEGEGFMNPSQYSDQEAFFSCGPIAASALACQVDAENLVHCFTSATGRTAISFESDAAAESGGTFEANEEALPIEVTLPDGTTCAPTAHDHGEHYQDYFSWYLCEDGSELLATEEIQDTFERGESWTAQHSVDQGAPEEVTLETVTFAGT
jgi:hypothetical protein